MIKWQAIDDARRTERSEGGHPLTVTFVAYVGRTAKGWAATTGTDGGNRLPYTTHPTERDARRAALAEMRDRAARVRS